MGFFSVSLFLVVSLITFHMNYVAISFTLGSEHKFCSSFWKPPKLWLHFSSLITSPHAPFIYPLSGKKVIGLEAVLTYFVGSSSENHSSGIPFSYKLLQFPVEVSRWVGHLPQVFRLFSAMPCRCSYQVGLLETTWKMDPLSSGDTVSSLSKGWEGGLWITTLDSAKIFFF